MAEERTIFGKVDDPPTQDQPTVATAETGTKNEVAAGEPSPFDQFVDEQWKESSGELAQQGMNQQQIDAAKPGFKAGAEKMKNQLETELGRPLTAEDLQGFKSGQSGAKPGGKSGPGGGGGDGAGPGGGDGLAGQTANGQALAETKDNERAMSFRDKLKAGLDKDLDSLGRAGYSNEFRAGYALGYNVGYAAVSAVIMTGKAVKWMSQLSNPAAGVTGAAGSAAGVEAAQDKGGPNDPPNNAGGSNQGPDKPPSGGPGDNNPPGGGGSGAGMVAQNQSINKNTAESRMMGTAGTADGQKQDGQKRDGHKNSGPKKKGKRKKNRGKGPNQKHGKGQRHGKKKAEQSNNTKKTGGLKTGGSKFGGAKSGSSKFGGVKAGGGVAGAVSRMVSDKAGGAKPPGGGRLGGAVKGVTRRARPGR
jgi:hypothetical protein